MSACVARSRGTSRAGVGRAGRARIRAPALLASIHTRVAYARSAIMTVYCRQAATVIPPPSRQCARPRPPKLVIVAPLGHRERRASARYCRFMVTAVAKIRPLTGWWRSARRPAARVASHRSGRALELDLQLQRESVALEREKVRLECDKLALEREEIGIKRARVEHASRCSSSSASASETQWR